MRSNELTKKNIEMDHLWTLERPVFIKGPSYPPKMGSMHISIAEMESIFFKPKA